MQVELANRLLRLGSFAHGMDGVVEEQVTRLPLRPREIEKAQVKPSRLRDAIRLRQRELLRLLGTRQEDRHAINHQGARQPVDNRREHLVEVGFGVQVAAELDQRLSIVVAFAIEEFVEIVLHPVLEWIEQQRCHRDGDDAARSARRWESSCEIVRKCRRSRRSTPP